MTDGSEMMPVVREGFGQKLGLRVIKIWNKSRGSCFPVWTGDEGTWGRGLGFSLEIPRGTQVFQGECSPQGYLPAVAKGYILVFVFWSYLFYFWLLWAFIAVCGLSPVAPSRDYSLVATWELLIVVASLVCGTRALGHVGFCSCSALA